MLWTNGRRILEKLYIIILSRINVRNFMYFFFDLSVLNLSMDETYFEMKSFWGAITAKPVMGYDEWRQ